jgi:hypothetical protein
MQKVTGPGLSVGVSGYSKRPAFADIYAVAGRFISIESDDDQLAGLFRRYFSGWHVDPVLGTDVVQPDATIRITAADNAPEPRSDLESFEVADGGVCRTDATSYFFERNNSVVRANNDEPSCVEVWIGNTPADRDRSALARLVFNASMTAMRRCGLFELHAAGVVGQSGDGLLIVGPSGSGKSTMATQLASAGWRYLSDDSLLLYLNHGRVEARALRRAFAVTDETLSVSGMEKLESIVTDPLPFDPLKKRFEPSSAFPDSFIEVCVPTLMFFSQVTREPASRARALSHSETMAQLIRMCPWACYDQPSARAHLNLLGDLARQTRAFELFAGRDMFGDGEYAGRYLLSLAK